MDACEENPSYKKPVLSDPFAIFHFFFQTQAQTQSCFFLKLSSLLFPWEVVLLRTCDCHSAWLRKVILIRNLEDRAAFDPVPPQMYEPN